MISCKKMRHKLLFTILLACWLAAGAADTRTRVWEPSFRSLQVSVADAPYAPPIVALGLSSSQIMIEFDELADDRRYLRYSLEHLDAAWQPDGLVDSEFVDGFNEGLVEDYAFSQATLVHYVNYRIYLPNEQVRITASGNYLVKVYDEEDPDRTLLQARFSVSEMTAGVVADVTPLTDIDANGEHQQLSIKVDTRHLNLRDPFNDLKVVITQNSSPDEEVTVTTPQRYSGQTAFYEHLRPLIFKAGNEYRRFETVSTTFPGIGVETIRQENPVFNAILQTDRPRATEQYTYDSTQQGRFKVRASDVNDSSINADYILTHFSLEMPREAGSEIYIEGELTDRLLSPYSRMEWNPETGRYERSLLLKQGSYNYRYVTVDRSGERSNRVEGDKAPTVNEYTVRVYHRSPTDRTDRLVGTAAIKSGI